MTFNIKKFSTKLCGTIVPVLLPPLHISALYHFWKQFSRRVDKHFCSCSCWDTVFKGTYESGIASYKHMYFNATTNTLKIWVITVICVIALYECVRHLTNLAIKGQLRLLMLILFGSSIFSHYYSWWAYVNYWNDDFYSQWYHQLFFTITELFSTINVLILANAKNPVTLRKALSISGIAILHVVTGSLDQFVQNVIQGAGHTHQVVRDLCFMIPDILHILIPLWELKRSLQIKNVQNIFDKDFKRELLGLLIMILIGFLICSML